MLASYCTSLNVRLAVRSDISWSEFNAVTSHSVLFYGSSSGNAFLNRNPCQTKNQQWRQKQGTNKKGTWSSLNNKFMVHWDMVWLITLLHKVTLLLLLLLLCSSRMMTFNNIVNIAVVRGSLMVSSDKCWLLRSHSKKRNSKMACLSNASFWFRQWCCGWKLFRHTRLTRPKGIFVSFVVVFCNGIVLWASSQSPSTTTTTAWWCAQCQCDANNQNCGLLVDMQFSTTQTTSSETAFFVSFSCVWHQQNVIRFVIPTFRAHNMLNIACHSISITNTWLGVLTSLPACLKLWIFSGATNLQQQERLPLVLWVDLGTEHGEPFHGKDGLCGYFAA